MNDVLVISDDLDLPVSAFRIRKSGGAGGHKGILSIMNECGTNDFPRLRIGIGRSNNKEVVDFVLSKFMKTESFSPVLTFSEVSPSHMLLM